MVDYAGGNADPLDEIRATVTIEAPAPGILIANTTGDPFDGTGIQKCYILVDEVPITASNSWVDHDQDDEADCIAGATVVVAAGTHAVDLRFVGVATNDGTLTALWVLFDGQALSCLGIDARRSRWEIAPGSGSRDDRNRRYPDPTVVGSGYLAFDGSKYAD